MGESPPPQTLSKSQKKMFNALNLSRMDKNIDFQNISAIYERTLEALEQLKNVPQSEQYKEVYKLFFKCKLIIEYFQNPFHIK